MVDWFGVEVVSEHRSARAPISELQTNQQAIQTKLTLRDRHKSHLNDQLIVSILSQTLANHPVCGSLWA